MAEDRASGITQSMRFSVDLKPGETTIVSWKKLTREPCKGGQAAAVGMEPPAGVAAAESRIALEDLSGECEPKDVSPPQNRFSAVIEKIERLYKGAQSSDEEELDVPDDDQYDTEDSFIDDTELDEYFQVDKLQTKHSGFFVNRGKLERINEPLPSPNQPPKKCRRKDLNRATGEKESEGTTRKLVKMGGMRMKTAARNAPLVVNRSSSPVVTASDDNEHFRDSKSSLNPQSWVGLVKAKHADATVKSEASWSAQLPGAAEVSESGRQILSEKNNPVHVERISKKASRDTHELAMCSKVRDKEKSARHFDLAGVQYSSGKYPMQKLKLSSMLPKEGSGLRPKGTMIERAIRELESKVAESRPPTVDVQDNDAASQGVKRRLPREVKQKLAKVARLAQSSQGRISDELINRLMSILGHLVQLKTLKRNLKEAVELGLSAKQEKEDRFQLIKREVTEMVRAHVSSLKSKEALGSDDKEALKGRYNIDNATEDRLYDLYDLYVEGMDEDKGPHVRKLYVELAELWPEGLMDNHGIKQALSRAKERKRAAYRLRQDGDRIGKKKISSIRTDDSMRVSGHFVAESTFFAHPRTLQEKRTSDSNLQGLTFHENQALPAPPSKSFNASSNGASLLKQKIDMTKTSMTAGVDDTEWHRVDVTHLKKKPKIKPEFAPGGNAELIKFNKQVSNSTSLISNQQKSATQLVGSQGGGPVQNS